MTSIKFDNAFDAVTGDKEKANELQIKADLIITIRDIVEAKGWKQNKTAEALNLTQPRVSDLLNGKIDKFSIDLLMTCLFRLGFRFKPSYENNQLSVQVQAA